MKSKIKISGGLKKHILYILLINIIIILTLNPTYINASSINIEDNFISIIKNQKTFEDKNNDTTNDKVSFKQVERIVNDKYIEGNKSIDEDTSDINELFNQLDEYSKYYNKDEFNEFLDLLGPDKASVGIELKEEDGKIVVSEIKGDSSASKARIKVGDKIVSIDGIDMSNKTCEEALDRLTGKRGTQVLIRIERGGKNTLEKELIRNTELHNHVSSKVIEGIGYIRISKFTKNSFYSVKDHVDAMEKEKVDKVILDLRNNTGGYLDQAIRISELFVPRGPIVHVNYKNKTKVTYSSFNDKVYFKDVCVLVNEETASAAEIVTAAIKDSGSGTIIGKKTYGKGLIQEIIRLDSGQGMKITVAEYFSPKMRKIDTIGITPDIVVENIEIDNQLLKAIEILNRNNKK